MQTDPHSWSQYLLHLCTEACSEIRQKQTVKLKTIIYTYDITTISADTLKDE